VPKDSGIVVNIPAFRMDVFENGAMIKSYKVGIDSSERKAEAERKKKLRNQRELVVEIVELAVKVIRRL